MLVLVKKLIKANKVSKVLVFRIVKLKKLANEID